MQESHLFGIQEVNGSKQVYNVTLSTLDLHYFSVFQQTVEAVGVAAGNAIQAPMQAAYREAFQNIVIPSFERTTQNMFQQVTDTFQRGTKECKC